MISSLYQQFRTRTFNDIFPNVATFSAWLSNGMFTDELTSANKSILYYSLVAKYGNSHISNSDENQFKVNISFITFKYGPNWQRELALQTTLRTMSLSDLQSGGEAIYNSASNPGDLTLSSTVIDSEGKLKYINNQNTTKYKKSPLEAYAMLESLLQKDVTNEFISKYKDLFLKIAYERPLLYESEEDEGDET